MRKVITLTLTAAVAACSSPNPAQGAPDKSAKANVAVPTPVASVAAPAGPADTHTVPEPIGLEVYKDWTVGCDNTLTCKAVALAPELGDVPDTLMSITRAGGPNGAFSVRIDGTTLPGLPVAVSVDGKVVARGGALNDDKSAVIITGADARAIALAAVNGQAVMMQGGDGYQAKVSLSGLSAALRFMDDKQSLAGTTSALVARGNAVAKAAAPALPVIRAINGSGAITKLSAIQIKSLRHTYECTIAQDMRDAPGPDYAALDGGRTLVLLPCESGAYNVISIAFIVGKDGKPVLAEFDSGTSFNDEGATSQLVNAVFENNVLYTDAKSRGIGDCGITQSFVWDGKMFRLSEQAEMGECRGSLDFIPTWRAQVVR